MSRSWGRRAGAWRLGLVLATLVSLAFGQDQVEVRLLAGYGDLVPAHGRLVPIQVLINNPVKQTRGRIVIRNGEVSESYAFQSPQQSQMRHQLLTRVDCDQYQLRVEVIFEDETIKTRWRDDFRLLKSRLPILQVGVPQGYFEALPEVVKAHYQVIPLPLAELPDNSRALDSVYAVVISGLRFSELSQDQLQALANWVRHQGGRLTILSPPPEPQFEQKLARLLGPDRTASDKTLLPLGAGLVLLDSQGLLLGRPWWLSAEKDKEMFMPALFTRHKEDHYDSCGQSAGSAGLLSAITRRHGAYGVSGFLWLSAIMGSYLLVIGPLDWFITRKTKKPQLTWPIFLGAIAVFSVIAYLYSSLVHSGPTQGFQMQVLDLAEGQTEARGNALVWLYSTRNARYTFSSERAQATFSARSAGSGAATAGLGVQVNHGAPASLRAQIPVFSDRQFNVAWTQAMPTPIVWQDDARTKLKAGPGLKILAGRLVNGTEHRPLEARLDGVWELGEANRVEAYLGQLNGNFTEQQQLSREELPSVAEMEGYLLGLSLQAGLPSDNHYARQPSQDELPLVLPAWPPPGKQSLLLLLVEPDEPWLGLEIEPGIPENRTLSLLRLYLRD